MAGATSSQNPQPLNPAAPLQERRYLLDHSSRTVYKDVSSEAVPEACGKWVQGRVVFIPPTSEVELWGAVTAYLQRKAVSLEDLFTLLDADLDGALTLPELRWLLTEVMPHMAASEVAYFEVHWGGGEGCIL